MPVSVIASSTTAAEFAAVDGGRKGFTIENSDANRLYVLLGQGTASSSNYSFSLAQNENMGLSDCRERISGVWAVDGSGFAMVTTY